MSKCAVHMMKMKMSAMGGIQSHNQREHESKKNKEIDYEKSKYNYDTVLQENINYNKAVKKRIAELNLKKAIRKDAVVYCSFIVSSDRDFFYKLGEEIHSYREIGDMMNREFDYFDIDNFDIDNIAEPTPFEMMTDEYKTECIKLASDIFFKKATEFFQNRYGKENVINGTVHLDEATPHMHIGIVPVTNDGRLCAKEIFKQLELKQLQTDFAEQVGKEFNLERGKEGSDVKHLDEVTFKIKKREEELESINDKVKKAKVNKLLQIHELQKEIDSLNEHSKRLIKTISDTKAEISTLEEEKSNLGQITSELQAYKNSLENMIAEMSRNEDFDEIEMAIKKKKALKFIELTDQTDRFEEYCRNPKKFGSQLTKNISVKRDGLTR